MFRVSKALEKQWRQTVTHSLCSRGCDRAMRETEQGPVIRGSGRTSPFQYNDPARQRVHHKKKATMSSYGEKGFYSEETAHAERPRGRS